MNRQQKEVLKTFLKDEENELKELQSAFEQAKLDCILRISELSTRAEMNPENLQSIIYQKQFQEAILGQIDSVLSDLNGSSYESIHAYLEQCYTNGYLGAMYDIHAQGIPIMTPIDQRQVVQALTVDSKLSKGLYDSLGEDIDKLKIGIRREISRGIAQGGNWTESARALAHTMNSPFVTAMNNSMRIVRTEGHRIQVQSQMDACHAAQEHGANIVKQWDAALDERTRDTHRELDGQIRELDDDFVIPSTRASAPAPSMFGDPAEDINCRCSLLQRARWALDDDELETLQERAIANGLYDENGNSTSNSFNEFINNWHSLY